MVQAGTFQPGRRQDPGWGQCLGRSEDNTHDGDSSAPTTQAALAHWFTHHLHLVILSQTCGSDSGPPLVPGWGPSSGVGRGGERGVPGSKVSL